METVGGGARAVIKAHPTRLAQMLSLRFLVWKVEEFGPCWRGFSL